MHSSFFHFCYMLSDTNLVEFFLEKRSLLRRCGDDKDQLFFFFLLLPRGLMSPKPMSEIREFLLPPPLSSAGGSLTTHGERERERVTLEEECDDEALVFSSTEFSAHEKREH